MLGKVTITFFEGFLVISDLLSLLCTDTKLILFTAVMHICPSLLLGSALLLV